MNESKIPGSPPVGMAIYDVPGNEANGLINQRQSAGVHQVTWDATNQADQAVPSGFYFVKMNCGQFSGIRKCLYLK
jgi:flagellar hook assembly protein FlgD